MLAKPWIIAAVAALGLSACGDTLGEQLLAGGAVGAGGAVVTGGNAAEGAVIGAAANAAYCQTNPGACR